MRFCKDCRHHVEAASGTPENAYCDRTRRETVNIVTGEPKIVRTFCEVERGFGSACGPDGKLFVAREREAA